MRTHMGIAFEVWNGGHAWFWLVNDPRGKRAAIGAVADESAAVREACSSIEDMSAQAAPDSPLNPEHAPGPARCMWKELLANLDRYLVQARLELA